MLKVEGKCKSRLNTNYFSVSLFGDLWIIPGAQVSQCSLPNLLEQLLVLGASVLDRLRLPAARAQIVDLRPAVGRRGVNDRLPQ